MFKKRSTCVVLTIILLAGFCQTGVGQAKKHPSFFWVEALAGESRLILPNATRYDFLPRLGFNLGYRYHVDGPVFVSASAGFATQTLSLRNSVSASDGPYNDKFRFHTFNTDAVGYIGGPHFRIKGGIAFSIPYGSSFRHRSQNAQNETVWLRSPELLEANRPFASGLYGVEFGTDAVTFAITVRQTTKHFITGGNDVQSALGTNRPGIFNVDKQEFITVDYSIRIKLPL